MTSQHSSLRGAVVVVVVLAVALSSVGLCSDSASACGHHTRLTQKRVPSYFLITSSYSTNAMDRSHRTGYNLRSLNETRPEPSPQWPSSSSSSSLSFASTSRSTSFSPSTGPSSTTTSSGFVSREPSSLVLAQQSHPPPPHHQHPHSQANAGLTPDMRMCALLPSPSATETHSSSWLQPQAAQNLTFASTNSALTDHNNNYHQAAATSRSVATTTAAANYSHEINGNGGGGGPTTTAPFLRDLNLVAEAAKRAQMSVVMRDLEGITL